MTEKLVRDRSGDVKGTGTFDSANVASETLAAVKGTARVSPPPPANVTALLASGEIRAASSAGW